MSQETDIVSYLKRGNQITVMDAMRLFDCASLSQRMGDALRHGHPIRSTMIKVRSGKWVACYWYGKRARR